MEFYTNQPFQFDEDTTDTEDDSGIAEISSLVHYANNSGTSPNHNDEDHEMLLLESDFVQPQPLQPPGIQQQQQPLQQPQDALGRFFSYW